jgi:hypothetical protein
MFRGSVKSTGYPLHSPFSSPPVRHRVLYRGADKSLARSTYLSIVFSVQGTGGSPTGPDTENRVGDQDIGSPGRVRFFWVTSAR